MYCFAVDDPEPRAEEPPKAEAEAGRPAWFREECCPYCTGPETD